MLGHRRDFVVTLARVNEPTRKAETVLNRIDHIAIEVPNLEEFIETFVETGGLKLIRRGVATATGQRIAMLGDRIGTKIELIETPGCKEIRYLHVAFASSDLGTALDDIRQSGWNLTRGPSEIAAAQAKSAFLEKDHLTIQLLEYRKDSPDLATW